MTTKQRTELARGKHNHLMNVQENEEDDPEDNKAVQMLNAMLYSGALGLNDDRLYLDNCLTITAIKNKTYISNVCKADKELNVSCNPGVATMAQVGTLGGLDCWYMPEGIANILLIHKLEQLCHITYGSWDK